MKIGLLAYSTNTGLGYQTLEFYENMNPDKVLIADLSVHNGVETHHERFPNARIDRCMTPGYLSKESCEWLVDDMDVVFVCETPLNYYIYEYAKQKGVKVVQQYNFEFLDYFRKPKLPVPDVLASPSKWGIEIVDSMNLTKVLHWPVPVNTKKIPFRRFVEVETFVHIIGRPAANDRNGTVAFLEAAKSLGTAYNYLVYLQPPTEHRTASHFQEVRDALNKAKEVLGENLKIIENEPDNTRMYSHGEVLVLPRRYGGLCLPMWEALSAGMPVIMPNVSPNNTILPKPWLVEADIGGSFKAHTDITLYTARHDHLAARMSMVAHNIEAYNKYARELAESMSWEAQKPIYLQRFKEICEL